MLQNQNGRRPLRDVLREMVSFCVTKPQLNFSAAPFGCTLSVPKPRMTKAPPPRPAAPTQYANLVLVRPLLLPSTCCPLIFRLPLPSQLAAGSGRSARKMRFDGKESKRGVTIGRQCHWIRRRNKHRAARRQKDSCDPREFTRNALMTFPLPNLPRHC